MLVIQKAIIGAIRGMSKEKINQELVLESFESRRWFRKLCFLFKNLKNKSPDYLFRIIPQSSSILQEIHTKFLFLKLSITFTKIRFFRVLLLNGIISIKTLGIVKSIPWSALVS